MNISINARIINGPWGGGNQAVKAISDALTSKGHRVSANLRSPDIDLILMIHPNSRLQVITYGIENIRDYMRIRPDVLLVHRINTSDERKGTNDEDKIICEANRFADFTVYISNYLRDYYIFQGVDSSRPNTVILNGADEEIFNFERRAAWCSGQKLRIVTHHWSGNFMKGFDVYERLDQLLDIEPFRQLFDFTIIGNTPRGVHFKNAQIVSPLAGKELVTALKQHHLYLTASRNEPAGMHHIEGMRCGLPVIFLKSGALPEYCTPYGIGFTLIDFETRLLEAVNKYQDLRNTVLECPYTSSAMTAQYLALFEQLIAERHQRTKFNRSNFSFTIQRYLTFFIRCARRFYRLYSQLNRLLRARR